MNLDRLIAHKHFRAFFIAQFGGVLNDNIFRSAILILIAFDISGNATRTALLNNLALILFLLPMMFLSPIAGQLVDRSDKSGMMRKNKIAEIIICILATLAFAFHSSIFMLFVLFLLGAQSAMFGPNKYTYLSQILPQKQILAGNALIATGTFMAIGAGVFIGGFLATLNNIWLIAGPVMIITALIGYSATRSFPCVDRGSPDLQLDTHLFRQVMKGVDLARSDRSIWVAILGLSWFWAFSSAVLTQLPAYTRFVLGGDSSIAAALIGIYIIGLGIGAFLSTRTNDRHTEPGLIPLALMGLITAGFILAIDPPAATQLQSPGQIFNHWSGQQAGWGLLLFGISSGLYLVPQYVLIQQRTHLGSRARVVALTNLVNALFMVLASLLGLVLLVLLHWSIKSYFLLYCLLSLAVLARQFREFGQEFWRLISFALSRAMYRVKLKGLENIPSSGPAVLVCNHLSYVDSIILFGTIRRRTRFIMEDIYYRIPLLNIAFKGARTIPISSPLKSRTTFLKAEQTAVRALQKGELVFIFPEGRLSPAGQIIPFKRGVIRILERQPVPVIPVAIKGLWGSFFSHGGNAAALKGIPRFRLHRRKVSVCFGEALEGQEAQLQNLEDEVKHLYSNLEGK